MAGGKQVEALVAIDKLIDKYVAEPLREKMHEELFALLPEKVEVMSDEEIICPYCNKPILSDEVKVKDSWGWMHIGCVVEELDGNDLNNSMGD